MHDDVGWPSEGISETEASRPRVLAAQGVEAHGLHPADVRLDLVGVLQDGHGPAEVEHVRGIG